MKYLAKPELKDLPIELLTRGKYQPRENFDDSYIEELAISIKENGLIQPIVVRPMANNEYEIIAGECRWRAAQKAFLDEVPCLIRNYSDEQAIAATTIENIQRKDLNPIEEAKAYRQFVDKLDYMHEEIAAVVGKSRTKITNSLRLLKLDDRIQEMLIKDKISEGHGKVIAGLASKLQFKIAQECVARNWSVRKLEQEARKIQQVDNIRQTDDPNIQALERIISDQVGAAVKLEQDITSKGGWLKIKYFSNDTLVGLLDKLGVKREE